MKKRCRYAVKYKATRKPTCGCEYCNEMWKRKNTGTPVPAQDKAGV
jgi:hypothetical protein